MFGTPVPLPVDGPLTDTELRASAVPVSGTVAVSNLANPAPISQAFYSEEQEIAQTGMLNGKTAYVMCVLGRRASFTSTSVFNDIKEFDTSTALFAEMTGAESLEIHSSSATDTDTAGGAVRKVKIVYIDTSYNLVESAAISLNGGTTAIGLTMLCPLWMEAVDWGSGGVVAAGNILLRTAGGGAGHEQISAGGNRSLSGRFMVPDGYKGYIVDGLKGTAVSANQDIRLRGTFSTLTSSLLNGYLFKAVLFLPSNTSDTTHLAHRKVPARGKVTVSTISSSVGGGARADAEFLIILVAD